MKRISQAEAEAIWRARDRMHQLGTLASRQSLPLRGRGELQTRFAALREELANRHVPCPSTWVGYRVIPDEVEFWHRAPNRLHARELFTRRGRRWVRTLLNP